jgi:hypothetical protein
VSDCVTRVVGEAEVDVDTLLFRVRAEVARRGQDELLKNKKGGSRETK